MLLMLLLVAAAAAAVDDDIWIKNGIIAVNSVKCFITPSGSAPTLLAKHTRWAPLTTTTDHCGHSMRGRTTRQGLIMAA